MEKFWGCVTGLVKSDMGNQKLKASIKKEYPDAVDLGGPPGPYETYVHGHGYVKDTDQEAVHQEALSRKLEIQTEQNVSGMKNDSVTSAKDKISNIFDDIRSKPNEQEKFDALINKCELIFKKIAVELLS